MIVINTRLLLIRKTFALLNTTAHTNMNQLSRDYIPYHFHTHMFLSYYAKHSSLPKTFINFENLYSLSLLHAHDVSLLLRKTLTLSKTIINFETSFFTTLPHSLSLSLSKTIYDTQNIYQFRDFFPYQ